MKGGVYDGGKMMVVMEVNWSQVTGVTNTLPPGEEIPSAYVVNG